ncbi:MAG TPA: UDP-N-acetylmuramoyl-L-alanine--D-glutamate ligase [Rhodanobacteraceae bacterium]|nr:UDP-N-acetylmuramoyl-L-alanine--D-glutamate ligase [Rhodanobacteraceae bacterium]
MRLAALEGRRVAVWGCGREGRAALAAIRAHLPQQALTLFCTADEAAAVRADDIGLDLRTQPPDADALAAFDVVVKSPGISAYKPEVEAARARGTTFTSGTALWFAENPGARVVAVTGTKGKSTTSALIAHLARALGVRTALAGNIGLPLLELRDATAELWVIELSSFQTGEAGDIELGVVVNLYEEHLDWHGTRERYVADKLKLADRARTLLVDAGQPLLLERTAMHPHRATFGAADGWHVAAGAIRRGDEVVFDLRGLPLPGAHNALNACAALAALERVGLDARAAAPALAGFQPLPHRLQALGERGERRWIDDSISTTPQATLAALRSLPADVPATLVVGGFERGLDWTAAAAALAAQAPHAIVAQGANGQRIVAALRDAGLACALEYCNGLEAAVQRARALTPPGGAIVLSPGAPSFDQFRDYAERGRRFADLAGFDGAAAGGIAGLGIA